MGLFTREQFAKPDDEAGVFIDGLGRALNDAVGASNHREENPRSPHQTLIGSL